MQILTRSAQEFAGDSWETENTREECAGAVWKGSRHAVRRCHAGRCLAGGRIIAKKRGQVKRWIGAL